MDGFPGNAVNKDYAGTDFRLMINVTGGQSKIT